MPSLHFAVEAYASSIIQIRISVTLGSDPHARIVGKLVTIHSYDPVRWAITGEFLSKQFYLASYPSLKVQMVPESIPWPLIYLLIPFEMELGVRSVSRR